MAVRTLYIAAGGGGFDGVTLETTPASIAARARPPCGCARVRSTITTSDTLNLDSKADRY